MYMCQYICVCVCVRVRVRVRVVCACVRACVLCAGVCACVCARARVHVHCMSINTLTHTSMHVRTYIRKLLSFSTADEQTHLRQTLLPPNSEGCTLRPGGGLHQ